MSFHDPEGNIVIEAASNDDGPSCDRITIKKPTPVSDGSVMIVCDFAIETPPVMKPDDLHDRIVEAGYRSMLAVHFSARDQGIGLQFWSKTPRAFAPGDAGTARRVAHHVARAISHEQLADAARQVAEAHARAERLEARVTLLSRALESQTGYARVVGRSDQWMAVLTRSTQVAATDTTVLVTGESGTGKEVVARFIHRASTRAAGPYVAINCAALPDQLLESELFGHERGAFTGAQQAKPGQIELAAGGTFFLDEVAEMSPSVQAKFLRVLQEREFQRLGGTRTLKANIRVIAATNRDLGKAVERGDFREDLLLPLRLRHCHSGAARSSGRYPAAGRRVPRGSWTLCSAATARRADARCPKRAVALPVARQRPRAAQRARARRHPQRGGAFDRAGAPGAAERRREGNDGGGRRWRRRRARQPTCIAWRAR